jgi:hypothetical protein
MGLGTIMIGLGALIVLRSFRVEGNDGESIAWRPLVMLSLALASFGLLIETAGFLLAVACLVGFASLAGQNARFKAGEVLLLLNVLLLGSWALFIYGLGLPLRLFW